MKCDGCDRDVGKEEDYIIVEGELILCGICYMNDLIDYASVIKTKKKDCGMCER